MIRRYNYTQRSKIPKSAISVRVYPNKEGMQTFDAQIDLTEQAFPEGSEIFLEAYYRNAMMRFKVGTFNTNQPIYWASGTLSDLQDPQVNFRIKVVDKQQHIGRLIGIADRVQLFNEMPQQVERIGLLPVRFKNLGEQVWLLEIPDDGTDPELCINDSLQLEDIPLSELVRGDPLFLTIVFPQVVRSLLEHLVSEDDYHDDDPESWQNKWVRFAAQSLSVGRPPESDDEQEQALWIDDAVRAFCKNNNIKGRFEQYVLDKRN